MTSVTKLQFKYIIQATSSAETIWKILNGVFAVYKPADVSMKTLRYHLKLHFCKDLNELDVRPPEPYTRIEETTNKEMVVKVEPSYADNVLVVGPRYQEPDFRILNANYLSKNMSGVAIIGVNRGTKTAYNLSLSKPISYYKVKGILGQATNNYFINGKIIEKSTYKHVKRHHIDMICASIQSTHQKTMFEVCGVDIQSQAAYELAAQGLIRPTIKEIPMIYSIKCIDFKSPEFTLEIIGIHIDEITLTSMVNNLGLALRSTATCTLLQCYQWGIFTIMDALLKRNWHLQEILDNMNKMRSIIRKNKAIFHPEDPILRKYPDPLKN